MQRRIVVREVQSLRGKTARNRRTKSKYCSTVVIKLCLGMIYRVNMLVEVMWHGLHLGCTRSMRYSITLHDESRR